MIFYNASLKLVRVERKSYQMEHAKLAQILMLRIQVTLENASEEPVLQDKN